MATEDTAALNHAPLTTASRLHDVPPRRRCAVPESDIATQPHDAFIKELLRSPERAIAFFQGHLPPAIVACFDWRTLTLMPSSFVHQDLKQTHSDLLFSVTTEGREMLIYVLVEHQTSIDPLMPLRMLGYTVEILREHEKTHGLPLPVVLPMLVHQGPDRWTVPVQFNEMFDLPAGLAPHFLRYLPSFEHVIFDLTQHDPADEESHLQLRVALQLMKLARETRLVEFLHWLDEQAYRLSEQFPVGFIEMCLLYAVYADTNLDLRQVAATLAVQSELREQTMSFVDKVKLEGRAEGLSQGRVEGRAEGRSQGEWIGRVRLLQELMGAEQTPAEQLNELGVSELAARFAALQAEYDRRFKAQ